MTLGQGYMGFPGTFSKFENKFIFLSQSGITVASGGQSLSI